MPQRSSAGPALPGRGARGTLQLANMVSGWVTPWVCHRRGERMGSCPTDTTRAVNGPGPSWTIAEEWEGGFDAYTRQRRSDDDIRSVVADPDKRGAGYTLEKKLTYARERGYAARGARTRRHRRPRRTPRTRSGQACRCRATRLGQPPKPHRPPQVEHRAHQTTPGRHQRQPPLADPVAERSSVSTPHVC